MLHSIRPAIFICANNHKCVHLYLEKADIMRRSIVIALTIVVIATSYGEFIAKTKVAKGAIQRNIYSGKEASALQCAHRCKFQSTTAVTVYKDELELCSCVEIDEDKSEGDLTEVFTVKNYKVITYSLLFLCITTYYH